MKRIVLGVSALLVACGAPPAPSSPQGSFGGGTFGTGGGFANSGGGAGGGSGGGGASAPSATGWLLYKSAGALVAMNMADGTKVSEPLDVEAGGIGFGGGWISDVIWDDYAYTAQIEFHQFGSEQWTSAGQLPLISWPSGYVNGPSTPSPDRTRFTLMTRESAGGTDPYFNYVSVLDANGDVLTKVQDVVDPVWLGANTLVAGRGDGLYTFAADGSSGPTLLAATGGAPWGLTLSADGRTLGFAQDGAIYRIGVDGSALTQLTLQSSEIGWAAFSPDGTQLAVQFGGCTIGYEAPIILVSATTPMQNIATQGTPAYGNTCTSMQWVAQ